MKRASLFIVVILLCLVCIVACVPKPKTIQFISDDTVVANLSTAGKEKITLPDNPQKNGFVFEGWFVDKDVWDVPFGENYLINTKLKADMKVYAKWTEKHSVLLMVDGEVYEEIKTNGNEILVLPNAPQKTGYKFGGWFVDENVWETEFTANYLKDTELNANLNVYAKWTEAKTIFFMVEGEIYDEIKTNGNEVLVLPDAPEKTGYRFDGWFVDENVWETEFTADYFANTELTANINIYAKFSQKKSVNFYVNGELYSSVKTDGNETITLPDEPIIDGHVFEGWFTDDGVWENEFTATSLESAALTEDLSVYAKVRVLYTSGLLFSYLPNSASYAVSGYIGTSQTVKIPNTFEGKAVTDIADSAFRNNSIVTSIIIPDGIERINGYAFYGCVNLQSIQLPDSVKEIEDFAFFNCTALQLERYQNALYLGKWILRAENQTITEVTIKSGTIGIYAKAFLNCASLTTVTLPEGVAYIGEYAFFGCGALTNITIADSVRIIGRDAFAECPSLVYEKTGNCLYLNNWLIKAENTSVTSVTLKDTTVGICRGAFANCAALEEISLPDSLVSIGEVAFSGSGISFISIPSSLEYWGERVFFQCPNLASVEISEGIKYIPNYAFYNCPKLVVITIPDSVESIGIQAFTNCENLIVVNISDNIFYIGDDALSDCPSLQYDRYDNALYLGNWVIVALNENITEVMFKETTLGIYAGAFSNCYNLVSAPIPQGMIYISEYAFYKCFMLEEINIPDSVMYIGSYAYYGCAADINVAENNPSYKSEEGILYDKKGETLIACPMAKTDSITLPSTVKKIEDYAFFNCIFLVNINIPDSVTTIGHGAFNNCKSLVNITIPESVTSLGGSLFNGCISLESVNLPSTTTAISDYMFKDCGRLSGFVIPQNVNYIGEKAFYNCASLTNITIPQSVTSIGDSAFFGCAELTGVIIPNNVVSIGTEAFKNCTKLAAVTIGKKVMNIGERAFENCGYLRSIEVAIDNDYFTSIDGILYNEDVTRIIACPKGKTGSIVIPNTVTVIDDRTFLGCDKITEITLGENVQKIGENAFEGCAELVTLNIPSSVTFIGQAAFKDCAKLTYEQYENCSYIGDWLIKANDTDISTLVIKEGTRYIYYCAFLDCVNLTNVTLPETIISIGNYSFYGCTGLITVTLNNGLISIGNRAFNNCTSLTTLNIPDSVTSIGLYAFTNSNNLTYVEYGNALYLDKWLIKAVNTNITETTIKEGTTHIYMRAYYGCNQLTSVSIPSSVTSIGLSAFSGCTKLSSLTFNEGLRVIEREGFLGCTNLVNVALPESLETIGYGAFVGCNNLVQITFGSNLTSIEGYAFWNCFKLREIIIPDSVTYLGDSAFEDCKSLESVVIGRGVTVLDAYVFEGCIKLAYIVLPQGITNVNNKAFYNCHSLMIIYYEGDESSFNDIVVGDDNHNFVNADVYYFAENEPTEQGNYWHFVDGVPRPWTLVTSVRFVVDGIVYDTVETQGNETITLPDPPLKAGYDFGGWYLDDGEWKEEFTGDYFADIPLETILRVYAKWVEKVQQGLTFSYDAENMVYTVTGYQGTETEITIPSVYMTKPVTAIAANAFSQNKTIVTIFVPASITAIGTDAFSKCSALTTIIVAESNTVYRSLDGILYNNDISHLIVCPAGKTGAVVIPDSVTKIDMMAFDTCTKINSMKFGSGITEIDNMQFKGLYGLTTLIVSDTVRYIRAYAFYSCTNLTTVIIGKKVSIIEESAFEGTNLSTIYYNGTASGWSAITKGKNNPGLTTSTIYYYSETEPTQAGNYWHYVEGEPVVWIIKYNINFISDGNTIHTIKSSGNETITLPDNPAKEGFTFDGWFVDNGVWTVPFTADYFAERGLSENFSVYAKWTAIIQTKNVLFKVDGNLYHTIVTVGNELITLPENPTKPDYTFDGWFVDENVWTVPFTADYLLGQTLSNDLNVYAKWAAIKAISFYVDGVVIATVQTAGKESIILPNVPTKTDYTFAGWFVDENTWLIAFTADYFLSTRPTEDLNVYAKWVESYTEGLTFELLENGTYYVKAYSGTATQIRIPNKYLDVSVTEIGYRAFYSNKNITGVIISDSVTIVGKQAFMNCSAIVNVTIGNSVTTIDEQAFMSCSALINVNLGSSVTTIGVKAFRGDSKIIDLTIPDSVTVIGEEAFNSCSSLANINFGNGVTTISKGAFQGCSVLTTIIIPDSVKTIGDSAFIFCSSLNSVTLGNSVETIDDSAFASCTVLTSIALPASLISIHNKAFVSSTALATITVDVNNTTYTSVDGILYNDAVTELILCPAGKEGNIVIPDSVLILASRAFYACKKITGMIIPDSVTTINVNAVENCSLMTYVVLGSGVTAINNNAFNGCTALTNVYYKGDATSWTAITVGDLNVPLINATRYYYSATMPETTGNYWQYVEGVPTVWVIKFNINFIVDGETVYTIKSAGSETITLPDNPTKEDFTFDGWFVDFDVWAVPFTADYFATTALEGSFNVYAKFTENSTIFSILFYTDSESAAYHTIETAGNETITLPENPTKEGFTFKGWYLDEGTWLNAFTADYFVSTALEANLNVYAKWAQNYQINFYVDGETIQTIKSAGNESITLPTPTKEGYVFEGWFVDDGVWTEAFDADYFAATALEADFNVYAKWAQLKTISFYVDGVVIATVQTAGKESITLPDTPTKTDYTFVGWYVDEGTWATEFTADYLLETRLTEDFSVYAKWAESYTEGLAFTLQEDDTYYVTGYSGTSTQIKIPNTYLDKSVTGIGNKAFYSNKTITDVVISDSVTVIGDQAYMSCSALINVTLGNGVTNIGYRAFRGDAKIAELIIPDSVTFIGADAFNSCTALANVTFGSGIITISKSAFQGCVIVTVTLPDSVTSIEQNAFAMCSKLTTVNLGSGLTTLAADAFGSCPALAAINVNESNENYFSYDEILYDKLANTLLLCPVAKSGAVTVPEGIVSLPDKAFYNCKLITSVIISDSVTSIGDQAFYGSTALENVTLGNSVTSIGNSAFKNNKKITEIILPDSVTTIGTEAFSSCSTLVSVVFGSGIISISEKAFASTALVTVTLPDSVTSIDSMAFYFCTKLTTVNIGIGLTTLAADAFGSCDALAEINVSDENTQYFSADGILYDEVAKTLVLCPVAKAGTVTVPEGIISLPNRAFNGCKQITSIIIADSVTSIGNEIFRLCSALTSVVIGSGVETIGSNIFNGATVIAAIYYKGDATAWAAITIGDLNDTLNTVARYYYSETEPVGEGDYWYYLEGVPTVW